MCRNYLKIIKIKEKYQNIVLFEKLLNVEDSGKRSDIVLFGSDNVVRTKGPNANVSALGIESAVFSEDKSNCVMVGLDGMIGIKVSEEGEEERWKHFYVENGEIEPYKWYSFTEEGEIKEGNPLLNSVCN